MSTQEQMQVGVVGHDWPAMVKQAVEVIDNGDDVENAFFVVHKKDGTVVTLCNVEYPLTLTGLLVKKGLTDLTQVKIDRIQAGLAENEIVS